jgi:hypothetical protein
MDRNDANNLARAIVATWKLGPEWSTWSKFLEEEVEKPEAAIHAIANLRKQDSDSMNIGRFWVEYTRIVVHDMAVQYNAHADCVACEGLGWISYTERSPVTGLPTDYCAKCDTPIEAANQAEWDYYFKPIHPRDGRDIAYTSYVNAGGNMPRQQFMRKLGDLTTTHVADTGQP